MATITGTTALIGELRLRADAARREGSPAVIVGYTQAYALYVHENMQADGTPGKPNPPRSDAQRRAMFASIREREARGKVSWRPGQPKFLEAPARAGMPTMATIVANAMRAGQSLGQALLMAGLWLQRESQRLCPVYTGALRASAFTRMEERG